VALLDGILALLGGFFGGFASEGLRHLLEERARRADRADQALAAIASGIRALNSALMSVFPGDGHPLAATEEQFVAVLEAAQSLQEVLNEFEPMLLATSTQVGLDDLPDHVMNSIRLAIRPGYVLSDADLSSDDVTSRLAEISEDYHAFEALSRQMLSTIAARRSQLQGFHASWWQFWRR